MIPDSELAEKGLLIVTGSALRAERADRPLAYKLKQTILSRWNGAASESSIVVLSDLWYLNAELLHKIPMISIGGPGVNAVSSYLFKRLPNALMVDDRLLIQMDMHLKDLRVCIWGIDHELTVNALEIFAQRDYLDRFLQALDRRP